MTRRTVVVVGGGLSGLSAACELADAGFRVTLLEKRPFLGGRAYSYTDKASGLTVDNGQHVFLGCCTRYLRFLDRLGAGDSVHLQKRFRVPVIDRVWGESTLRADDLPPPAHLLRSLLSFRSLSPREKVLAGRALSQIMLTDRTAHPELDEITFEQWLLQLGQSPRAIRSLWNLIVLPTLNTDISAASADLALMVFQEGFLRSRSGANVGWAKVGLSELLGDAARRYIEGRGGEIRLGEGVLVLGVEAGRVAQVRTDGGEIVADAVVLAVTSDAALDVLPPRVREDQFFARVSGLQPSPIVNVHIWYDRPVWDRGFAAFLNSPVQWIFNKSKLWGQQGPDQYLDISLSGADDFAGMASGDIIHLFTRELAALLPAARGAELRRALVVKQRDATFAAVPGVRRLRPPQATPIANLFLAGDWTDTGWPATMEGAVRSGVMAADAVRASLAHSAYETARA